MQEATFAWVDVVDSGSVLALDPRLAKRLRALPTERLLVLTGAGISAESGIPTYRGHGGLWRKLDFEALATRRAFDADPVGIWRWYDERRAAVGHASPNAAHVAVAKLADAAADALVVTQNVDDLHERRGLAPSRLVHVHGSLFRTRCGRCGNETAASPSDATAPCVRCGARALRPAVVWYDEELPEGEVERIERFLALGPCPLVLVVGTTASFDYIRDWADRGAGRDGLIVDVNPEASALSGYFPGRVLHARQEAGAALTAMLEGSGQSSSRGL